MLFPEQQLCNPFWNCKLIRIFCHRSFYYRKHKNLRCNILETFFLFSSYKDINNQYYIGNLNLNHFIYNLFVIKLSK